MIYEMGEKSGTLIDLVYDCIARRALGTVTYIDTDRRIYRTVGQDGVESHNARGAILVVGRVVYLNTQPGMPLPNVTKLLRRPAKPPIR